MREIFGVTSDGLWGSNKWLEHSLYVDLMRSGVLCVFAEHSLHDYLNCYYQLQ